MKVKGKVTPALRDRVLELVGQGLSLRQVEAILTQEGTPLSRTGVSDVAKAAKRELPPKASPAPSPVAPPEEAQEVLVELPELPADASIAARVLMGELREARTAARAIYGRVISGEFPLTQWVGAKAHVLRLLKQLDEMLPPPAPDPAKDPTNISAREMIHAHVLRTIRAAEERSGRLCPECRRARGGGE